MRIRPLLAAIALSLSSFACAANIKSSAPQVYTVQEGDTLWGISKMYLDDTWKWQELWNNNSQIQNPNLIYPGDELHLTDGKIVLHRKGHRPGANSQGLRTVKLTPQKREVPLDMGLPVISYNKIKSTLTEAEIVNAKEIKDLPYIISTERQTLTGGLNQRVYIQGALVPGERYGIYSQGETFKAKRGQKEKNQEIGTILLKTGEITIERVEGEMSTGVIKSIKDRRIAEGQRLLPLEKSLPNFYFEPKTAPYGTETEIISLPGYLHNVGSGFTVVLDRGLDAGLDKGDILLVQSAKKYTKDPYTKKKVALPSEAVGTVMVYKVFDQTSLGVVMETTERIQIGDNAVTPHSGVK